MIVCVCVCIPPFSFSEDKFVLANFIQEHTDKAAAVHNFPWIGPMFLLCKTPKTTPLLQTPLRQQQSFLSATLTFCL